MHTSTGRSAASARSKVVKANATMCGVVGRVRRPAEQRDRQRAGLDARKPRDLVVADVLAQVDQCRADEPVLGLGRLRAEDAEAAGGIVPRPLDQLAERVGLADPRRAVEHQRLRSDGHAVEPVIPRTSAQPILLCGPQAMQSVVRAGEFGPGRSARVP